ncbi:MAG TPA: FtsW/RodA/SpoVE family cell cycle protein, partial [Longimicrobiales bacterium]
MALAKRIRSLFGDPALVFTVFGLTIFGIFMIYSAGRLDVPKPGVGGAWRNQITWLVISLIGMFTVTRVQVRWIEWLAVPLYTIGLIALIATLIIGTGAGTAEGTKSWLRFGGFMVQPSQFANLATILMLGRTMGAWRERPSSLWDLWKPIAIVAVPMLLVLAQPDLGTAMVFGGLMLATLYWAGTPIGLMFMLVSPIVALFIAIVPWLFSVYMLALLAFLYFYRAYFWEASVVV